MAVKVNGKGVSHARSLIASGDINEGAWSFSASDGNKLLGDDDWAEYGRWFLATDSEADSETKDHYKYPFGKNGQIYRRGVIAAKSRAAQQGATAVADAADSLLEAIDAKLGKDEDSASTEPERRFMPISVLEIRDADDGAMLIEGYPIVYEVFASIWGFREVIRTGAAGQALKRSDEFVLWDHESAQPMARRSAGTLEVKEDEKGVFIRADVSKTRWGRDGYEAIKAGVTTQMSFAFDVAPDGQKWRVDEIEDVKIDTREITEFGQIYDYSPVSYPAYKQTIVNARSQRIAFAQRPKPRVLGDGGAVAQNLVEIYRLDIRRIDSRRRAIAT